VVPVDASSIAAAQPNASSTVSPAVANNAVVPTVTRAPKPAASAVARPAPKEPDPVKRVEKQAPVQAPPTRPASAGKPRLQLDPVDNLSGRIKSLEASSANKIAQEQVLQDNQKMQRLQADLRSLLDQAVKNEASLAAMRERLEKAESDRVPMAIVYTLIALLLLCVVILAYLLSRRPGQIVHDAPVRADEPANTDAATMAAQQTLNGQTHPAQDDDIDVNLLDLDDAAFSEMMDDKPNLVPTTKSRHHDFNADALVDIRQQADFLAKLGKVDEALQVLERGIQSNPVESPLLYLDLLVIANNSSRKTDFQHYSAEFATLFNAVLPEFALFKYEGRKLDAYPALLDHINEQWESPHVLDVIEACIVRDPDATESDPFDLAAFRDLLNMHASALALHHIQAKVP
jgi:hypothetical protein